MAIEPPSNGVLVAIKLDENALLTSQRKEKRVSMVPDPIVVGGGQTIVWVAPLPFNVRFVHGVPLKAGPEVRSMPDGDEHVASAVVRGDAVRPQQYKCIVALYDQSSQRIYTTDPEVIVEPDPPTDEDVNRLYE